MTEIWSYGAINWSIEQADRYIDGLNRVFQLIAVFPDMGREHCVFSPPVRICPYQRHIIIYVLRDEIVIVLRVLGGSQDWQTVIRMLDI